MKLDPRRILGGIGRAFIALGALILLFVAYQLWGTGLSESRSQDRLRHAFGAAPGTTLGTPADLGHGAAPTGEAVAIVRIPKIGVDKAVIEGVGVPDLKKGPGHYPGTPLPGQVGNAAIAGHRTTYGAPFYRLDELRPGDLVYVTTRQGAFRYSVIESRVVTPRQVDVLGNTSDSRLTLTTCNPRFSAKERLVVIASLLGQARPATVTPVAPGKEIAGLSGDQTARGPAIAWGLMALVIGVLTWLFSHLWRRWPSYLIGAPVFLVALFLFYDNVARLLPANV